jgi:DNA-binding transcriptional regulator YiaG
MARRKTHPESIRAKLALAERFAALRTELFGERGGPEMARRLGIPVRTWYNYEGGVTIPVEVALKIIELTSVEPAWLLHGEGPKFRPAPSMPLEPGATPAARIAALLRSALKLLENDDSITLASPHKLPDEGSPESADLLGDAGLTPTDTRGTRPTVVAAILSIAGSLQAPEELEELSAGLLVLKARLSERENGDRA